MNLNKYTWVIFGAGAVVKNYHLPAFEFLDLLKYVTIVDLNKSNLEYIKNSYPQVNTVISSSTEYIETNNFSENTLALIALPNNLHKSTSSLLANKRIHSLCEKPLSLSVEDINDLEKLVQEKKYLISTAMVRRFLPSIQALKLSIQESEVYKVEISDGEPFAWIANSPDFFLKSNGGVLADMGVHYLDLIQYLFGEVDLINYSDDFMGGVEANCECVLKSKDGINIILKLSRTKYLKNEIVVSTNKGDYIVKKNVHSHCSHINRNLIHDIYVNSPFTFDLELNFESCFVEQLVQFVNNVEDGNYNYISPLTQLNSTKIIQSAYQKHTIEKKFTGDKIFISGGSGFIGTELIKSLQADGSYQIVAPMHSYKNCSEIACYDIDMPRLNLFNQDLLNEQLKGIKQLVHLAYSSNEDSAYKVNLDGTKNLVNAAIKNGVESIVILSTMYVFGHHNTDKILDENIGYHPYGGVYAESKLLMEKWCLERSRNSGNTRIVILNPTCVYGPNGKTYSRLPNDLVKQNKFAWIDNGMGVVNYVFIHNLIDAIMLALNNPKAHGNNFIINDGHTTWKDFINNQLVVKSNHIPNLNSNQRNTSAKFNKSILQVLNSLLMNYEVLELINSNKVLFKIKKSLIKLFPKTKHSIHMERSLSAIKIKTINNIHHNPPEWLFDLFPNTKTRYSSNKAKNILGWNSRIGYEDSMSITSNWLKDFYNIKN